MEFTMLVAVTDYTFPDLSLEESILAGYQVRSIKEKRGPAELIPLVADADAVITQFAPVNAEVIAAMNKARVIVRYGIGVDNIDLEAARLKGIPVCNIPGFCADEVADHTLAFILGLTRQVPLYSNAVHAGTWGLVTRLDEIRALRDMTVGVVGFGRIGREVVSRLKSFKCPVVVYDPVVPADVIEAAGCQAVSLDKLFSDSDLITLHCPSTAVTRGFINRESLNAMKRGVLLVNLSRGDLVDSGALVAALDSGQVAAAALDVFAPEPIPADHPILKRNNVILAPHIASVSVRAVKTLRETAAQTALKALRGEPLPAIVNGVTNNERSGVAMSGALLHQP
jgi:D-3-phosphoglycerate dehydrogenase / 2-oxoglutarate reductase